MSRKQALLLIPVVLSLLWVSFVLWERRAANDAIGFEFVSMINLPGMTPQALFKITNRTHDLIVCQGCGYLEPGESGTLPFCIPAGTGPWRASLRWQRRDLNRFEELMNRFRDQLVIAFGARQYHRDPWIPPTRVSYSPEIQR
jgi:hypothetical protein